MDVLQPVDEPFASGADSDGGMTTSPLRTSTARAVALALTTIALGLSSPSPAGADRPDDGSQAVTPTPSSHDIDLVVAFRKSQAAQYAVDHATELAGRS
jgi:hypothetical protein